MQKILTRRAKEYFEVLDELRQEGFITHEEWQVLPTNDQLTKSKMTNRIIEDALIDHNYSKGSPNELKKYRQLWMQERDISPEINELNQNIDIQSDPILSAVDHFRKKIYSEAEQKTQNELNKLQDELDLVKKHYFEKSKEYQEVTDDCERLAKINDDLKSQCQNIDQIFHNELKKREIAEKRFEDADKNYNSLLDVNHQMLGHLASHDIEMEEQFNQSINTIISEKKSELTDLTQFFEKQLQDHLLIIEQTSSENGLLKGENEKLSGELLLNAEWLKKLQKRELDFENVLKEHEKEFKTLEDANKKLENEMVFVTVESIHLKTLAEECKNQRNTANELSREIIQKFGRLGEKVQQTEKL